ncbi:MAG TPA: hypothetical protein VHG70_08660 [Nocardioidaceae bacterium]|nr:hypothetical protein [Nocardioidaceae bacterium]
MSELDPETQQLHDKTMAEEATLQEAVNAVAALRLGQDVPATMTALSQAIASRGLVQPTRDWLTAVAVEISHGNRYVVGTSSEHDAAERERHDRR